MSVALIYDPVYLKHDTGAHVENGRRLTETVALLEKWFDLAHHRSDIREKLIALPPRPASLEEVLLVHTREHVSRVQDSCERGGAWLDGDTVTSPGSCEAALYAVGGALRGVEAVMEKKADSAFALVRPPGHHATPTRAMGFCLFNNVAIAAKYALTRYSQERVMVVDFDVHHGNGTQETFYEDPRVLYFSTHEYPWYPGSGAIEEIGSGAGKGATVNMPLPAYCGDAEYLGVCRELLVPAAQRFRPQVILVSAGYDAHWADDISLMQVTVSGFAGIVEIIHHLASVLCAGKLVFALEGGYHLEALPLSVKATFEVLLGLPRGADPLGNPPPGRRGPPIDAVLARAKKVHGLD